MSSHGILCCVSTCKSTTVDTRRSFFGINTKRLDAWAQILGMDKENVRKSSRICDLHFLSKHFHGTTRMRLRDNAVPSLHLSGSSSASTSASDSTTAPPVTSITRPLLQKKEKKQETRRRLFFTQPATTHNINHSLRSTENEKNKSPSQPSVTLNHHNNPNLRVSIQKLFCYSCSLPFDDLPSFKCHTCQIPNNNEGDESRSFHLEDEENWTDDDDIKPEINTVDPLNSDPPRVTFEKKTVSVHPKEQEQKQEQKKRPKRKENPLQCYRRKCKRIFPTQRLLRVHLKIGHTRFRKEKEADNEANDPISHKLNPSQNPCLQNDDTINVYCKVCQVDFSSLVQFVDHLWNYPHPQNQDNTEYNNDHNYTKSVTDQPQNLVQAQSPVPASVPVSLPVSPEDALNNSSNENGKEQAEKNPSSQIVDLNPQIDGDDAGRDLNCDLNNEPPDSTAMEVDSDKVVHENPSESTKTKPKTASTKSKWNVGPKICPFPECGGRIFVSYSSFFKHKRNVHNPRTKDRKLPCAFEGCKKTFRDPDPMRRHYRRMHEANTIPCSFEGCEILFKDVEYMKEHCRRIHERGKNFKCPDCRMWFVSQEDLTSHQVTHQNSIRFHCPIDGCKMSYRRKETLKHHYTTVHKDSEIEFEFLAPSVQGPSTNKTVPRKPSTFGKEKIIPCLFQGCIMLFSKRSNMKAHYKRVHEGSKNVLCPQCGDRFFDIASLRQHQIKHTSERKFKCTICGSRFKSKAALDVHGSIHTGEKKFLCSHCGQAFRKKDTLSCHLRTHSTERRFKCPVCPAAMNQKNDLKKHLRSRHPEFDGQI